MNNRTNTERGSPNGVHPLTKASKRISCSIAIESFTPSLPETTAKGPAKTSLHQLLSKYLRAPALPPSKTPSSSVRRERTGSESVPYSCHKKNNYSYCNYERHTILPSAQFRPRKDWVLPNGVGKERPTNLPALTPEINKHHHALNTISHSPQERVRRGKDSFLSRLGIAHKDVNRTLVYEPEADTQNITLDNLHHTNQDLPVPVRRYRRARLASLGEKRTAFMTTKHKQSGENFQCNGNGIKAPIRVLEKREDRCESLNPRKIEGQQFDEDNMMGVTFSKLNAPAHQSQQPSKTELMNEVPYTLASVQSGRPDTPNVRIVALIHSLTRPRPPRTVSAK